MYLIIFDLSPNVEEGKQPPFHFSGGNVWMEMEMTGGVGGNIQGKYLGGMSIPHPT